MDVHQAIELRLGGFRKGCIFAMAGVVDQIVDIVPAPLVPDGSGEIVAELGKAGDIAGIERQRDRLAACICYRGHDLVGSSLVRMIGEDDTDAGLPEMLGGVAAQPPAAAGDQCEFGDWIGHVQFLVLPAPYCGVGSDIAIPHRQIIRQNLTSLFSHSKQCPWTGWTVCGFSCA